MATKGPSNRYGNSRGGKVGKKSMHINYEYAKYFMPHDIDNHMQKHYKDFNIEKSNEKGYINKAIKFANYVDRKNCRSLIDYNGTTYKYNIMTKELVIVTSKGIIVSYYKISPKNNGFYYTNKKGIEIWKEVK